MPFLVASLRAWIARRQAIRGRWKADAVELIHRDGREAYNVAQRLAARARARRDWGEMAHWAKVAAEVARRSPGADMDQNIVDAIVDKEMERR